MLRHSRALAWDVLADRTPLDGAVKQVQHEQQRNDSVEAQMQELREQSPDLADLVSKDGAHSVRAGDAMVHEALDLGALVHPRPRSDAR